MSPVILVIAPLLLARPNLPTAEALVDEINRIRANPAGYAAELRRERRDYQGLIYNSHHGPQVMTDEGVAAVDDAIQFLERQEPLGPMRLALPLNRSSQAQANDLSRSGEVSHTGSDGSNPIQRIGREGVWQGMAAENIAYGGNDSAGVIRQFIVDDGVANRGHRTNLFSPLLKAAGAACAPHPTYDQVCVMDYATGILDKAAGAIEPDR